MRSKLFSGRKRITGALAANLFSPNQCGCCCGSRLQFNAVEKRITNLEASNQLFDSPSRKGWNLPA
jgi:hypothetical protein